MSYWNCLEVLFCFLRDLPAGARVENERVSLAAHFDSARKRQGLAILAALGEVEDRLDVLRVALAGAGF